MSSFPVGRRRLLAAGVVALLLAVMLARHAFVSSHAAPALVVPPLTTPADGGTVPPVAARRGLVVDVVGAVRHPGVYRVPAGSRVQDAVGRAGGLTARADPIAVNLAAPVVDGEQVVVVARGSAGAASAGDAPGAPVSLSAATAEQLDALPGVGPVTAQKIVDYRTQHGAFHSVDELDAIPGIGPSRIAQLQGLVVP